MRKSRSPAAGRGYARNGWGSSAVSYTHLVENEQPVVGTVFINGAELRIDDVFSVLVHGAPIPTAGVADR